MENSFGEYLRKQRESREISLDTISAQTKIKKKFLVALENDQYEQMPGLIFIRGFIRAYAEQVGMDPNQTIEKFEEYLKASKPVLSGPKSEPKIPKRKFLPYFLITVFALALIGLAGSLIWSLREERRTELIVPRANSSSLSPSSTELLEKKEQSAEGNFSVLSRISPPFKISIKASELCWILATIDGKTSKEAMLHTGEHLQLEVQEKLSLLVGNAGGLEVSINSIKLKPLGAHWKPMRLLIPEDLNKYLPDNWEKSLIEKTEPQTKEPEVKTQDSSSKPKSE